jgi:hypothetical protein
VSERSSHLLLECLGAGRADGLARRLAALGGAGWGALLAAAERHGVLALLERRLAARLLRGVLPTDALRRAHAARVATRLRNRTALAQLAEATAALRAAGVPTLVLKGAHLAYTMYGDPGLRPMSDVDLLVPAADGERAEVVLHALGYEAWAGASRDYARHHHRSPLYKDGALPLELHVALVPPDAPLRLDVEGIWRRAEPFCAGGVELLAPAPADLLEYLCVHAAVGHACQVPLLHWCDLDVLLRQRGRAIDWERVAARATEHGSARALSVALRVARELVGAPVGDEALAALPHTAADERAVRAACEGALLPAEHVPDALRPARAAPRGVRALVLGLAPSAARMRSIYGSGARGVRLWLYYLWRPWDLLARHGRAAAAWALRLERLSPALARAAREEVVARWVEGLAADGVAPAASAVSRRRSESGT